MRNHLIIVSALIALSSGQISILQDSRHLPQTDGTFGFLYRTEDGIAHAAKGDSNGVVHGRFTYTDPTGLKVNYNYNAGSRVSPGYTYDKNRDQGVPDSGQYEPERYQQPAPKTPQRYQQQYERQDQPPPLPVSRYQNNYDDRNAGVDAGDVYEEVRRRPGPQKQQNY